MAVEFMMTVLGDDLGEEWLHVVKDMHIAKTLADDNANFCLANAELVEEVDPRYFAMITEASRRDHAKNRRGHGDAGRISSDGAFALRSGGAGVVDDAVAQNHCMTQRRNVWPSLIWQASLMVFRLRRRTRRATATNLTNDIPRF